MTAIKTKADAEALINQEGVEYVSVRFTDLIGVQQHFTVPASEFLKDAFDEGMPFDGSSVEGFQAINESDMKLVPDVETAYIDPFRKHKTLNVAFSIVDPLTDFSDAEGHLNTAGAAKVTAWLGRWLCEHYELTDRRGSEPAAAWDQSLANVRRQQATALAEAPDLTSALMLLVGQDFAFTV